MIIQIYSCIFVDTFDVHDIYIYIDYRVIIECVFATLPRPFTCVLVLANLFFALSPRRKLQGHPPMSHRVTSGWCKSGFSGLEVWRTAGVIKIELQGWNNSKLEIQFV